ncbi:MAG: methylmalonyl-CoA mutase family protein [Planctomycetes bacterium]|nr:methylmalonyl-CoA mutase family protein [Planctomycetota bacterium]
MSEARTEYDRLVSKALQRSPERAPAFTTASGLPRERVYAPADPDAALDERLGWPGLYPFTRGIQPTMYRGRHWTMRQYAGFGSPAETNARFKALLAAGQTGLSVAFDLPTQIGYDSDASIAAGEVGKVGVPISTLDDMEELLDGIPLDEISISMTINSSAAVLLALLVAVARRRGLDPACLRGTTQNDILKEYVARGTFRFPIGPSMRLVTDTFRYCSTSLPRWNPISISGYHIREAGSTAPQELAFTFADGIAYVEAARAAGLDVDAFMPQLSFFFAAHSDLLEEVAKFRAARRLWARLARDRLGAKDPQSWRCRFHVQTGGVTLTARQPENNIVRVALQALSAVLGGCQSLHTNGMDEALALPTEASAVLALRTQQVIAHETGVADTVDPLGGSYALEALTDRVEQEATALLEKVDATGGMIAAIEAGLPQRLIQQAAYDHQRAVDAGARVVVGVNRFETGEEVQPAVFRVDPAVEEARAARLAEFRGRRDEGRARARLAALEAAAKKEGAPLVEAIVDAVLEQVTLGEVMGTLAGVFGEYAGADHY